jgi:hypothetical protein
MQAMLRPGVIFPALLLFGLFPLPSPAADMLPPGLSFHISARGPEQLAAFYAGRGFPESMVQEIQHTCFLTVGIRNERDDVVWITLDKWRFLDDQGHEIHRVTRPDWNARWDKINAPLANRSTFGWTQLPESRDLQPGEPLGGNIAVMPPKGAGKFVLEATLPIGYDNTAAPLHVRVENLQCPEAGKVLK